VLALSKLPVSLTAAAATNYVVVAIVLSWLVLHEEMDPVKVLALALTLGGVAILSTRA
jgi:drug/metabolite transporter (DMT)-like permease